MATPMPDSNVTENVETLLARKGTGKEWILADIPEKDVVFTTGLTKLRRRTSLPYQERDPIKLVARDGTPSLLVERENSLMRHLANYINFVPSVYANDAAIHLLRVHRKIK